MAEVLESFVTEDQTREETHYEERTPLLPKDHSASRTGSLKSSKSRPWYKRPSPYLLMPAIVLLPLAMSACIGPRLEVYSLLVCRTLDPSQLASTSPVTNLEVLPDINTPITVVSPWLPNWLASGGLDPDACRRNPAVARQVGQLSTALTLTLGILSAISTSYWAGMSSRRGRIFTMAFVMFGFALNDMVFLLTVHFIDSLTYRFLLVGPLLEGCLGGFAASTAVCGAYLADCTATGSRAKTFSLLSGVIFAGFGLGPTVGGLLVTCTNNIITPFYFSFSSILISIFFLLCFVPESLSPSTQQEARDDYEKEKERIVQQAKSPSSLITKFKRLFRFLKPLKLLLPRKNEDATVVSLQNTDQKQWTLTLVGITYALHSSLLGIYSVKMLYSQYKFGFGPVEIGYLLTLIGASRVLFLLVILPVCIKLFKEKKQFVSEMEDGAEETTERRHARHSVVLRDSHFDLRLARISIFIEVLSYFALIFTKTPYEFVLFSVLTSLAGGSAPALQSLALALAPAKDSASILGALSVISSTCGSAIGPLVFGVIWLSTFDKFTETIFLVGCICFTGSLICLMFVRLRRKGDTTNI